MNTGPVIDVLQKGDERLALFGFAVAPGEARQHRSKQNAQSAAESAIQKRHPCAPVNPRRLLTSTCQHGLPAQASEATPFCERLCPAMTN
jgi:hypothetical protein